jgi:hypothetical protein|tara:strand:+ start:87307 stop:87516 length:210 start_codon:yes stop_codon:yes gene_type:complete
MFPCSQSFLGFAKASRDFINSEVSNIIEFLVVFFITKEFRIIKIDTFLIKVEMFFDENNGLILSCNSLE